MIETALDKSLQTALEAIEVENELRYTMKGEVRDLETIRLMDPTGGERVYPEPVAKNRFKELMTTDIYNQLYMPEPLTDEAKLRPQDAAHFFAALGASNTTTAGWDDHWQWKGKEKGRVQVSKLGIDFWISSDRVVPQGGENGWCAVQLGNDLKHLQPAFYMVLSDTPPAAIDPNSRILTRFYWNLTPKGAPIYLQKITTELNGLRVSFKTKVLSNPAHYARKDAGVLYIDRKDLSRALPGILRVQKQMMPYLRNSAPLFTKAIAKGLGFAEDPGNGQSFGISRANLLAGFFYGELTTSNRAERPERLAQLFENQGISPSAPYCSIDRLSGYEKLFSALLPLSEKLVSSS